MRRSTSALDRALADGRDHEQLFEYFVAAVERSWRLSYAALVAWEEDGSGGYMHLERGEADISEPVLVSWLLREAESGQKSCSTQERSCPAGTCRSHFRCDGRTAPSSASSFSELRSGLRLICPRP